MRTREKGLVSIVVTNFNRESFIWDCLNSLYNQTYKNIEIIFIDDASTDQSMEIFQQFKTLMKKDDPEFAERLISLQFPRNIGYEGPLTMGMFLSKGEFIAIQDSDDISHPERIEKELNFLTSHAEIDLIGSLYSGFTDFIEGQFVGLEKPANWIRYGSENIKKIYEKNGHCLCHGTMMVRGKVFDRLGGYSRRFKKEADYEFIRKCILNGVKADNIPEVLYYYRRHPSQMSKN